MDLTFYRGFLQTLSSKKEKHISEGLLEKLLVELEKQSGRETEHVHYRQNARSWMRALLEKECPALLANDPALAEEFC